MFTGEYSTETAARQGVGTSHESADDADVRRWHDVGESRCVKWLDMGGG